LCLHAVRGQRTLGRMATLHLRNVPPEIDLALAEAAGAAGTSKNREAIAVLRRGLGLDQFDRAATIREIQRARPSVGNVDVAALLRAERPADGSRD
jgi:plasmid stability protein